MSKLRQNIESIMNSDKNDSFLSFFLYILSLVYGSVLKLRAFLYEKEIFKSEKLPCRVMCVGNITAGGTGKTPMTIFLAEILQNRGLKPVIISRGYKGSAEKKGGIVSNGQEILMDSKESGDEPFMMAKRLKNIPVIVGQSRIKSGRLAVKHFNPDIILLDDGFQHLKLKRDINIVLLDSRHPFGNNHVMPRGMLREPLSALSRGDIFVFTRTRGLKAFNKNDVKKIAGNKPVFTSFHTPYIYKIINKKIKPQIELKNARAVAFSGIAKNHDFLKTLNDFGCNITRDFGFPDHYSYSNRDINTIIKAAQKADADILVTTEKDYARMDQKISWPVPLVVIGIKVMINEYADFEALVC